KPVPRWDIARIDFECLTEERIGLSERFGVHLPPELPTLQIERIGLRIGRAHLRRRAEQLYLQLLHHLTRDLVLNLEDVIHLTVVGLRPEMVTFGGADELCRDP